MIPKNTNDITDQNDILYHNGRQISILGNINRKVEHHNSKRLHKPHIHERLVEYLGWDWLAYEHVGKS